MQQFILDLLSCAAEQLIPLTVLVLLPSYAHYIVYNLLFHPLSAIPGPFLARTGAVPYMAIRCFRQDVASTMDSLHRLYGPTVRIGRNRIATIDPSTVHKIYAHGSHFRKSEWYSLFTTTKQPNAFSVTDLHEHGVMRRAISHAFSMTSLVELEEFVDGVVLTLLEVLDTAAEAGHPIDLSSLTLYFAMDVVGELAFGQSFNLLNDNKDTHGLLAATDVGFWISTMLGSVPSIGLPIFKLLTLLPVQGVAYLGRTAERCVDERMKRLGETVKGGDERKDMLTKLVKSRHPETKRPLSRDDIITHASTIIGAGADTTSIIMLGFFGFVLSRPAVLARLRQEIDDAVRTGRVVLPASYAQGVQLDYFQACLKETLRLWPAVAHPMERIVPCGEAIHVDKFVLPPGTVVGTSALVFHRSYEAFGDDADQFKPERWLGIDEATRKTLEKNNIAFGAGGRVNISLMELTKVIPQLLYRYDMSFTPREKGSPHRHLRGKDLDGKVAKEVPYYVESDWFVHPKDFWCNVAMRPIEDGL